MAINLYYEQFLGLSVPMSNPLIRSVRQSVKRAHVEMGSQQKVRRSLTWGMLKEMQESVPAWRGRGKGVAGRVLLIGLALSCYIMLRASELFANGKGMIHEVYCLKRGDAASFKDNEQLVGTKIHEENIVEVRCKGLKRNEGRKRAELVRTRTGRGG